MSDNSIHSFTRYGEGLSGPDVSTMCKGQCEGTGFYPVAAGDFDTPYEATAWKDAHDKEPRTHAPLVHAHQR